MVWFIIGHLLTTLLDWVSLGRRSVQEKDLEMLLLGQQLAILQRKLPQPVRRSHIDKLTMAVLVVKLKALTTQPTTQLREVIRLFQPETVLKWHCELVRRKWTFHQGRGGGRPRTSAEVEALITRFVRENPDWGYGKLEGKLRKLGYLLSEQTVANILKRHDIAPAP